MQIETEGARAREIGWHRAASQSKTAGQRACLRCRPRGNKTCTSEHKLMRFTNFFIYSFICDALFPFSYSIYSFQLSVLRPWLAHPSAPQFTQFLQFPSFPAMLAARRACVLFICALFDFAACSFLPCTFIIHLLFSVSLDRCCCFSPVVRDALCSWLPLWFTLFPAIMNYESVF